MQSATVFDFNTLYNVQLFLIVLVRLTNPSHFCYPIFVDRFDKSEKKILSAKDKGIGNVEVI